MCCLNAELGGTVHNGMPGGKSQLRYINLNADFRSGSCLVVGARGSRALCILLNNAHGASNNVATKLAMVGKTIGKNSLVHTHQLPPNTQTYLIHAFYFFVAAGHLGLQLHLGCPTHLVACLVECLLPTNLTKEFYPSIVL